MLRAARCGGVAADENAGAASVAADVLPPPPVGLTDLPLCCISRIVHALAQQDDAASVVALARSCRLLASVTGDELLTFAPLCRALAGGARLHLSSSARAYALAFRRLRLHQRLSASLWREAGASGALFCFRRDAAGATLVCARLMRGGDDDDDDGIARALCTLGDNDGDSDGDEFDHDTRRRVQLVCVDADRVALTVRSEPRKAAPSAVAAAVAAVLSPLRASPCGSPPGSFGREALLHAAASVQSRAQRRRARTGGGGSDAGTTTFLIRVAPLEGCCTTAAPCWRWCSSGAACCAASCCGWHLQAA
jgi:hypothetical protein